MKDKVITLKDGVKYYIIDETYLDNRNFCLGVEVLEKKEEITDNYLMFEVVSSESGSFIKKVDDVSIKEKLLNLFVNSFKNQ